MSSSTRIWFHRAVARTSMRFPAPCPPTIWAPKRRPLPRSRVPYLSWLEDNLDAMILFVAKDGIAVGGFLQAQAMRDHKCRINIAALDALQQGMQIAVHMGLTHL